MKVRESHWLPTTFLSNAFRWCVIDGTIDTAVKFADNLQLQSSNRSTPSLECERFFYVSRRVASSIFDRENLREHVRLTDLSGLSVVRGWPTSWIESSGFAVYAEDEVSPLDWEGKRTSATGKTFGCVRHVLSWTSTMPDGGETTVC